MSPGVRGEGAGLEPTPMDTEPGAAGEAGGAESPEGRPRARPVEAAERLFAVDALRGFALLGILAMNIVLFAWPHPAYDDPIRGGFEGTDRAVWFVNHLVFEAKMRYFRFGPAEWLWRSLTYWRPQPMRVRAVDASAAVVVS